MSMLDSESRELLVGKLEPLARAMEDIGQQLIAASAIDDESERCTRLREIRDAFPSSQNAKLQELLLRMRSDLLGE